MWVCEDDIASLPQQQPCEIFKGVMTQWVDFQLVSYYHVLAASVGSNKELMTKKGRKGESNGRGEMLNNQRCEEIAYEYAVAWEL